MTEANTHGSRSGSPGIEPGGATAHPGLDAADLHACMFTVADYIRRHDQASPSLRLLHRKLDRLMRRPANPRERDCDCDAPESTSDMERIGTREAAAILGCSPLTVRRHAAELGGVLLGDRWWYDAALVRSFRDERDREGGCSD